MRSCQCLCLALVVVLFALCAQSQSTSTHTVFTFSRDLQTCDTADNPILEEGTTRLVYAYNDQNPTGDDSSILYHGQNRGSQSVALTNLNDVEVPLPPDAEPLDLRLDNFEVLRNGRPTDTIYWCKTFQLPMDRKRHIVRIDPMVQPENALYVHHMLVYVCPQDISGSIGVESNCYSSVNADINTCLSSSIMVGWAVGGTRDTLPEEVGIPIGPGTPNMQVVLEVHYDNQMLIDDIVDSSGVRLWTTEDLRPIDAGMLQLGNPPLFMDIPPRQEAFDIVGYCASMCTEMLPPEGITMFSVILHAHLAGRRMRVQHLRNNTELRDIMWDPNYDFNYQQTLQIKPPAQILPGDELILTCTYNTEDRDRVTRGGIATTDEMCFAYISYFPQHPAMRTCISVKPGAASPHLGICDGLDMNRDFLPMPYEPLKEEDPCIDYEKPDLDRVPQPLLSFDASDYNHAAQMDVAGNFILYWSYDTDKRAVNFALDVKTTGWVGLGISPNGDMVSSDVFVGFVTDAGEVFADDRFAVARALPPRDLSQDLYDIRVGRFQVNDYNKSAESPFYPDTYLHPLKFYS